MTDQTCTAIIDGEKCGAKLTFRRVTRGGLIELYTCESGHNRHINRDGRQYSTHKNEQAKTHQMIRLYPWQREILAALGHTAQSFIDAKILAVDVSKD